MKLAVNGREVDLAKALPMTQGDLEDLEDAGVPLGHDLTIKQTNTFLLCVLQKADPGITRNDVRALTPEQAKQIAQEVRKFSGAAETEPA